METTITVKAVKREQFINKKTNKPFYTVNLMAADRQWYNAIQNPKNVADLATIDKGYTVKFSYDVVKASNGKLFNNIRDILSCAAPKQDDANPEPLGKSSGAAPVQNAGAKAVLPSPLSTQEEDSMLMDSIKQVQELTGMGYNQAMDSELTVLKYRAKLQRQYQQFEVEKMRFNSANYGKRGE